MIRFKCALGMILFIMVITGCNEPVDLNSPKLEMIAPTEIVPQDAFPLELGVRSTGKVVLVDDFNLSFTIPGQIVEITVQQDDLVHTGDVIARLDTTSLQTAIAEAEGQLSVSQAELIRLLAGPHKSVIAEAQFQATAIALETTETLSETIALEAEKAAAQARLDYLMDQPLAGDIAVAQAEVTRARLNLEAKKAQLELASLVVPVDGTVINVFRNLYEYVRVGETVVQIADLNNLSVQTGMYDFEIVNIDIGDRALITFDALPGVEAEGSIRNIIPDETNDQAGKYIIIIQLDEIPKGLRRGMTAEVFIPPK